MLRVILLRGIWPPGICPWDVAFNQGRHLYLPACHTLSFPLNAIFHPLFPQGAASSSIPHSLRPRSSAPFPRGRSCSGHSSTPTSLVRNILHCGQLHHVGVGVGWGMAISDGPPISGVALPSGVTVTLSSSHFLQAFTLSITPATSSRAARGCWVWSTIPPGGQSPSTKFISVTKHFDDFNEDQFDFHGYCVRKASVKCGHSCCITMVRDPSCPRSLSPMTDDIAGVHRDAEDGGHIVQQRVLHRGTAQYNATHLGGHRSFDSPLFHLTVCHQCGTSLPGAVRPSSSLGLGR